MLRHADLPVFMLNRGRRFMDVAKIPTGREPPHDINVIVEIAQGGNPVSRGLSS
jgi:hypothetical protein